MSSSALPSTPPELSPPAHPRVDDHFIQEGARVEVLRGILLMAPPAQEPHATAHLSLAYLLGAYVASGWKAAVDMLTRTSEASNFAPDASVYPEARDPITKGRQLEELAFEIADSQPLDSAGEKARELTRRGVRRVFCVVVKHSRVLEWSVDTDGWSPLPANARIEDRCFVRPLPARALVHASDCDEAVVAGLRARRTPALVALQAEAHAEGRVEGRVEGRTDGLAKALHTVLQARGLRPSPAEATRIDTADAATLERWLVAALTAPAVADLWEARPERGGDA